MAKSEKEIEKEREREKEWTPRHYCSKSFLSSYSLKALQRHSLIINCSISRKREREKKGTHLPTQDPVRRLKRSPTETERDSLTVGDLLNINLAAQRNAAKI